MNVTPNMIAFINICKSYKKEHGRPLIDFIALMLIAEAVNKHYEGNIPEDKKEAYEQAAYIIKEVEEDTNG